MFLETSFVLPVTVALQLAAAFFAYRLMRRTSSNISWTLITASLLLMAAFSSIHFYYMPESDAVKMASNAEFMVLLISALMVIVTIQRPQPTPGQGDNHGERIENILNDAIKNISEGFVIFDSDGRLVICNDRYKDFYKYSDEDCAPGVLSIDLGKLDLERKTVIYDGKVEDYILRRDDTYELKDILTIYLADGRILETRDRKTATGGVVSFQQDVTERVQARQALQQAHDKLESRVEERTRELSREVLDRKRAEENAKVASHAKSDLLANMSHELRTPLNAIIGFSGTIKEETFGTLDNEKYREYINDIHQSGEHLLELIDDILDVSAIEADAIKLQDETVSLSAIVDTSVRLIRPRAEDGHVTISQSIDSEIPMIIVDQRRMKQILLNLLSNAVKFTPEGGKVSLSARLNEQGSLSIAIADTGIGMDEDHLKIALSTFGQVDSGLDRKHEGTGLGLPLTKGLVNLHGGKLDVESEVGNGTQVTVTLPKERIAQDK
ncbi:MAG: hypothetical protein HOL66_07255 [Rhodospirillaceae bacterium]|jgi:signal transduction histidine kinase|nr:hypothetical protein [Rhodospirillaceae bacterium]MBT5244025.1 hypothetical protein [Rhodospirillaceae bacterium]MBT5560845.1 hypothetical protein [Rhodospirillaceae bacterium]MBT6240583.1 hypothetical protein [Rhodospirillaceae bacterium]MBT7138347.1 hypothetical protein [Rhodospirillaceae bacterium]